jgi:predicted nucleic acid-binding protein
VRCDAVVVGKPAPARAHRCTLRRQRVRAARASLIDVEVLSALGRLVASGVARVSRGEEAITDLLDLPIERYPHDIFVPRVWQLRDNFSACDATYVALAEAVADEPVPLLTADARLARAIEEHADVPVVLAA